MFGMGKLRELQQMAQNPRDSEMARSFASIIANLEHDLLDAVEDLHNALDVSEPLEVDQSVEDRVDSLLDVAEAAAGGDFETYWFGEVAGFENVDTVTSYAGLSQEAWEDQRQQWVNHYRQKAPKEFEDKRDREVVAWHVKGEFGVPLAEFEREVIGYSRREALQTALAGNIVTGIDGVRRAARAARSQSEAASDDVPEHGMHPNSPQPEDGGEGE
jgi:hypothetical protein